MNFSKFALGPHIDGGSLERWEDPGYRNCWKNILENNWRSHNPFDISPRLKAKFDLYGLAINLLVLIFLTNVAYN